MRVVMVTPEAYPFAKTGGLGDVLSALPAALSARGMEMMVCLPGYRSALAVAGPSERIAAVRAPVSARLEPAEILRVARAGVPTVLLRADHYFDRDGIYGTAAGAYPDNAERFVFFCRATLEWLRSVSPAPDVIHLHDWPTALTAAFLRGTPALYPELERVRIVFTIHNLAYQGRFWRQDWHLLNLDPRLFAPSALEFHGDISFLKGGLVFADHVTTVSPQYALEIQTPAFGEGLDGVLRSRAGSLTGILNGVDFREWDPSTDPHLPVRYDVGRLGGKGRCKLAVLSDMDLAPDPKIPLLVSISRFADQKGIDLLVATIPQILATTHASVAVLGSGERRYQDALLALAREHPRRMGIRAAFDEGLAHRLEAGGDVFLMPSRFEPCGLNQLYSLRYGTIPVVHDTGGLHDTVREFDPAAGTGTGFRFTPHTAEAFLAAIRRALTAWQNPDWRRRLVANAMAQDFSWGRSAAEYAQLYATVVAA